jgi:hypothetical protein
MYCWVLVCWPQLEGFGSKKRQASSGGGGGAILVFLPGAPEIARAGRALRDHAPLAAAAGGPQRLRILPLHGSLSAANQRAVFDRYGVQSWAELLRAPRPLEVSRRGKQLAAAASDHERLWQP